MKIEKLKFYVKKKENYVIYETIKLVITSNDLLIISDSLGNILLALKNSIVTNEIIQK